MNPLHATLVASFIIFLTAAAGSAASDEEVISDVYASPGTLVTFGDGRVINLRYSAEGDQVVLLEAGANADSSTWYRVFPLLQSAVKVCAYDRAGYGFSDEGPLPRDLEADVTDLHELIRLAQLPLPIILVGHSLGSNIVRRYAQQFPEDVAGLVLVDPPEQGADMAMPESWKREDAELLQQREAVLTACLTAAIAGEPVASPEIGCVRPPPAWMGERVSASVQANKSKPGYWRTLRSELSENQVVFSLPVSLDESYGDIPLVLLSANDSVTGVPDDVRIALESAREQTQQRIIAASTRRKLVHVPGSSHDIQLDQPEAVSSAVLDDVLPTTHSR